MMKKSVRTNWNIDGDYIKLHCKTEEQLEKLKDDVKYCLNNNLPLPIMDFDRYDIMKIISLYFRELGIVYFKNCMDKINREKGQFTKQQFLYEVLNFGNKFDWQKISHDSDLMEYLKFYEELANQSRADIFDIDGHLLRNERFADIVEGMTPRRILIICYEKYYDKFVKYLQALCRNYTNKMEVVCITAIYKDMFNKKYSIAFESDNEKMKQIDKLIVGIVSEEYTHQCEYFPKTNSLRMDMKSDKWYLFYLRGTSLKRREFDFTGIKSSSLKNEFKLYLKEGRYKYKKDFNAQNAFMPLFVKSLNFLIENNPRIQHFADIELQDVTLLDNFLDNEVISYRKEKLKPKTVANVIGMFRQVLNFLMQYSNKTKQPTKLYYPIPSHNPFYDITYYNLDNMEEPTDVIPEEVMNQLLLHMDDLRADYQKVFAIFNDTGIRADEALLLHYNCIEEGSNEFYYIPHKIISARRKNLLEERKLLIITDEVKAMIEEQIKLTTELRLKYNLPFIFINDCRSANRAMPSRSGFVNAVNRIIKKHDIRDLDNNLWHFTCRQTRKTVAENMILNNATPSEVQYQLGHLSFNTTKKHYAEIEKKKLADMETDFFRDEFEVTIGKENLELYSEEERRALYVDFKLHYRDVELGKCTKHFSEAPCSKISGSISCANCPKCATGKKYLPKWKKLRDSQRTLVNKLIEGYNNENIMNYESFIEYQREVYFLDLYNNIIERLSNE